MVWNTAVPAAVAGGAVGYQLLKRLAQHSGLQRARKRRRLNAVKAGPGRRVAAARKMRRNTSRTLTKTKKKKNKGPTRIGSQRETDGGFISVFYKKPKQSKMITWSKQPMTYEQLHVFNVASGASTATQSLQAITTTHVNSNIALGGSEMLTELFNRHAKIQNATGPATIVVDPTFATQRYNTLYFKNLRLEINVTNQAPTTCEFDVYIVSRKNSEKTFVANAATTDWSNGLTVMNAAGAVLTNTLIDTKPSWSKRFNQNWRKMGTFKEKLNAGEERKLVYNIKVNRFLDSDHWLTYAGGVKGIYHEVICVARGPTADSGNTFAAGSIATAKVKIVGFVKAIYTTYACNIFSKLHYMATDMTTSNVALYSIADAAGTVVNTETTTNYA